jgi:RNA polymerase sigma factor (sigma-70 family)
VTLPVSPASKEAATPDGLLLQEAVAGSTGALAALYDRYETRVFNYCLRLTGSREDAADATQEAFLSVLRRLRSDDTPVLDFSAYLFTTARHESYSVSRCRARSYPFGEPPERRDAAAEVVALDEDPERSALVKTSQEEIRAANGRLPPRYREVLALRDLQGASYDEIGDVMGMSGNAVAQLIWRARVRLRRELRQGAVASVVATSQDCRRAQALICLTEDGELRDEDDREWLDRHLDECGSCRASRAALREVGATYGSWLPVAAVIGMREDVLGSGGELVGASWEGAASSPGSPDGALGGPDGALGALDRAGQAFPHSASGAAGVVAVGLAALALLAIVRGDDESLPPGIRVAPDDRARAPAAAPAAPPRSERSTERGASPTANPGGRRRAARGDATGPARRGGPDGTRSPLLVRGKEEVRAPGRPPVREPHQAPSRPRHPAPEPAPQQAPKPPPQVEGPPQPPPGGLPAAPGCTHPGQGVGPPACPPGHGGTQPPGQVNRGRQAGSRPVA